MKMYFQWIISLHLNIYKFKILFDVNFVPKYIVKLKLEPVEIHTIPTFMQYGFKRIYW
jgi:hypothetical protein